MRLTLRTYVLSWFGLMILAIINGTIRDLVYKDYLGVLTSHQLSTVTLLLLFSAALWFLMKKWPLGSDHEAWTVGAIWFVMTVIFEFGMGLMRGASWAELFYAYNLLEGQVWLFIPLWTLVAPYVFYRDMRRDGEKAHENPQPNGK